MHHSLKFDIVKVTCFSCILLLNFTLFSLLFRFFCFPTVLMKPIRDELIDGVMKISVADVDSNKNFSLLKTNCVFVQLRALAQYQYHEVYIRLRQILNDAYHLPDTHNYHCKEHLMICERVCKTMELP